MSDSYRQILRSSSIMGGAQAINYLVGLIRVKLVALLLGTSGVGLVGVYTSIIGVLGSLTGLGVASSGVRSVADAFGRNNAEEAARMVLVLRRACWFTGILGWIVAISLAVPISRWIAGSATHAWAIGLLGCTLLLGAISGGQLALLQGLRRIKDIAVVNVWSVAINSLLAVGLYLWLGERGILPVLIATSVTTLVLSHKFARRVQVAPISLSWHETWRHASQLIGLGVAFMWSSLLTTGVDMFTRSLIVREIGMDAAGIYQAAWSLSGMFAAFILQAMGADFYPRLTGVIHDHAAASRAVNEQTEIGILLALPGLLATLAFSPWIIHLLYSKEFAPAAHVLSWMVLGVFGRVLSWPMGFIQLALGASRWFMATESIFAALQSSLMFLLIPRVGVIGAAYGFALVYLLHTIGMYAVGRKLIGFHWSSSVRRLVFLALGLVILAFTSQQWLPTPWRLLTGAVLCAAGSAVSLRGLAHRLGPNHPITSWILRLPGGRWLIDA